MDTYKYYNKNTEYYQSGDHIQNIRVKGELIPPHSRIRYGRGKPIDSGNGWQVRIRCPWCGKFHYHGWDPSEPWTDEVGRRVSHCYIPGNPVYAGYTIVPSPIWAEAIETVATNKNDHLPKKQVVNSKCKGEW